jgi:heme/copper-type cytochrome/quinol oxidase subunit 2
MPISVRVVSEDEYNTWLATAKTAGVEKAQQQLAAILKTKGKLALGAAGASAN